MAIQPIQSIPQLNPQFTHLPTELIKHTITFFESLEDLGKCLRISKLWKQIVDQESVWENMALTILTGATQLNGSWKNRVKQLNNLFINNFRLAAISTWDIGMHQFQVHLLSDNSIISRRIWGNGKGLDFINLSKSKDLETKLGGVETSSLFGDRGALMFSNQAIQIYDLIIRQKIIEETLSSPAFENDEVLIKANYKMKLSENDLTIGYFAKVIKAGQISNILRFFIYSLEVSGEKKTIELKNYVDCSLALDVVKLKRRDCCYLSQMPFPAKDHIFCKISIDKEKAFRLFAIPFQSDKLKSTPQEAFQISENILSISSNSERTRVLVRDVIGDVHLCHYDQLCFDSPDDNSVYPFKKIKTLQNALIGNNNLSGDLEDRQLFYRNWFVLSGKFYDSRNGKKFAEFTPRGYMNLCFNSEVIVARMENNFKIYRFD